MNHRYQRMLCNKFGYPCNLTKWYRRRIWNGKRLGQQRGKHQQETKKGQKSSIGLSTQVKFKHPPKKRNKKQTKNKWNIFFFLLESTTLATEEGTENTTDTRGRTQAYSSKFTTTKKIIVFTGTIISLILILVILREFYKYCQFKKPIRGNNHTGVIYANVADI